MRIGLFIDTFNLGGAEVMVLELASLLKEKGHEPVLLHFGNPYLLSFSKEKQVESTIVPFHNLYKKTISLVAFAVRLKPYIRELNVTCIHSHLFGSIIGMSIACRLANVRHFGTLHDIYTLTDKPSRRYLLKMAVSLGTQIIVISNQMHAFYRKELRLPANRLLFIPNFAPEAHPHNSDTIKQTKYLLGIKPKSPVIISVGRLVNIKRFDLLITAFERLDTEATLLIVGDGPERQRLETMAMHADTTNQIIFLGERSDVEDLLWLADIYTLVSDTEGLSRSILEAMSAGLPVIATNVGGNSDLVEENVNGYLLDKPSPKILSRKLQKLLDNKYLRIKFGKGSLRKAKNDFNKEEFIQRHLNCYIGQ